MDITTSAARYEAAGLIQSAFRGGSGSPVAATLTQTPRLSDCLLAQSHLRSGRLLSQKAGIDSLADLVVKTPEELCTVEGIGEKTVYDIKRWLQPLNLKLEMRPDEVSAFEALPSPALQRMFPYTTVPALPRGEVEGQPVGMYYTTRDTGFAVDDKAYAAGSVFVFQHSATAEQFIKTVYWQFKNTLRDHWGEPNYMEAIQRLTPEKGAQTTNYPIYLSDVALAALSEPRHLQKIQEASLDTPRIFSSRA